VSGESWGRWRPSRRPWIRKASAPKYYNISACRGAMDALMAEVIEGHIRFHILPANEGASREQTRAADDLVTALRAYLK
jgi:hypothetical protein